jgi:hypothetical protein
LIAGITVIGLFVYYILTSNELFFTPASKIYTDKLNRDWANWSWGSTVNFSDSKRSYTGKNSISLTIKSPSGALYLHSKKGLETSGFEELKFAALANGEGQRYQVVLYDQDNKPLQNPVFLTSYGGNPETKLWKIYHIPLGDLNAQEKLVGALLIQNVGGPENATLNIDDIELTQEISDNQAPPAPVEDKFLTSPPKSPLPTDEECAQRVRRSSWEPRPSNSWANSITPTELNLPDWPVADSRANRQIKPRINGSFTGTTDEILQWGACKWGFDEDTVRSVAVIESWWRQSTVGDKGKTFGIMQVKSDNHPGTFPHSRDSTAFNVDYALGWRRACFEGYMVSVGDNSPNANYKEGDEWGCIGAWFSGHWYDPGAQEYIDRTKSYYQNKEWLQSNF